MCILVRINLHIWLALFTLLPISFLMNLILQPSQESNQLVKAYILLVVSEFEHLLLRKTEEIAASKRSRKNPKSKKSVTQLEDFRFKHISVDSLKLLENSLTLASEAPSVDLTALFRRFLLVPCQRTPLVSQYNFSTSSHPHTLYPVNNLLLQVFSVSAFL